MERQSIWSEVTPQNGMEVFVISATGQFGGLSVVRSFKGIGFQIRVYCRQDTFPTTGHLGWCDLIYLHMKTDTCAPTVTAVIIIWTYVRTVKSQQQDILHVGVVTIIVVSLLMVQFPGSSHRQLNAGRPLSMSLPSHSVLICASGKGQMCQVCWVWHFPHPPGLPMAHVSSWGEIIWHLLSSWTL